MALILCIETSTTNCSVALSKDGKPVAVREVNNGYTHAENITVFIDRVLNEVSKSYQDLDAVAVSKGPGSYTGLRIGVSAAKGICFGTDKPLISIDTLYAMAFKARHETAEKEMLFCPMIDARRMEVYCSLYDKDLNAILPTNAVIIETDSFLEHLEKSSVMFFGDGAMKTREKITHPNAVFVPDVYPTASSICEIAERRFNEKRFEDVAAFEPFYLKDFIAGKGSVLPPTS